MIEVIVLEFLKFLGTEKLDISVAPEISRTGDKAGVNEKCK